MCVFVFVGVYIFCGLENGYIGLTCLSDAHKTACTPTQRLASCCLRDLTYDLMTDGPSLPETMATTIRKKTLEFKTARNNTNSKQ